MICAFVDRLFLNPDIREIRIDPRPANLRAIRSYEKAGFRTVQRMETPSGPALWMALRRGK
jgi:RimJ/RimL family protein N-acetyltransferase